MSGYTVPKRMVGGSSAERGLDFQARVSAIIMAHLLTERPLGWLADVLADYPRKVDAETGGPGDDICFVCNDGLIVEVQAKRGLKLGQNLWDALLGLADGVCTGSIAAGLLAVCPNSSGTVKSILADDIVRIGSGRTDGLREPGNQFLARLRAKSIDASKACSAIRIVTVAAVDGNREAENTACERLARVAQDSTHAWTSLIAYARRLIEIRGGATRSSISRELVLRNVKLKTVSIETSVQLQFALRRWLVDTHSQMSILGVSRPVSLTDCWITLRAIEVDTEQSADQDLNRAVRQYHAYASHKRRGKKLVDSHTLGRFVKRAVVLGGPGIGKSTLMKKLALDYSKDGFLVLLVKMPQVATLMQQKGHRFEDCLAEVALSASSLRSVLNVLDDAVILCDGLDECGNLQSMMTEAVHAFEAGHPNARILITSRPIGYQPGLLGDWRHYELQPLEYEEAKIAISIVLDAIPFPDSEKRAAALDLAREQLTAQHINGAAARSPLMLTLIAALVAKGIEPSTGQPALYRQLFRLIEDHPPARMRGSLPSGPERTRFLDLLGWFVLAHGVEPSDQTLERCALWWSKETSKGLLECEKAIQECLDYWEGLGVIERVRTLTQEAVTFVHKTFGEFAAARYISRREPVEQRILVAQAILTPGWKETISFASHLGLATVVLEGWIDLVLSGDSTAAYGLENAMELVVQSRVPVSTEALASFVECCWAVTASNASRTRYAGGEALCLVAQTHWAVVRDSTLARLQATDDWVRLVAWACACASNEDSIPYKQMIKELHTLEERWPKQPYLWGIDLSHKRHNVRESLILGAARRILRRLPAERNLEVFNTVLMEPSWLTTEAYNKLAQLYREAGQTLPKERGIAPKDIYGLPEARKLEISGLMELVDDPSANIDGGDGADERMLELGALLTATHYWELHGQFNPYLNRSVEERSQARVVLHLVARAAGIDVHKLIVQAHAQCQCAMLEEPYMPVGFSNVPRVDAEPNFDTLDVGSDILPLLEDVILRDRGYLGLNAAEILYSLRKDAAYLPTLERILQNGRGVALRHAASLAGSLPEKERQKLLLARLTVGRLTHGCDNLYYFLKPPFGDEHEDAIFRGLMSSDTTIAVAAATIVSQLDLSIGAVIRLRECFEEWKTREEPYPADGGTIPQSPRDKLAKVLVRKSANDISMLIAMMQDTRPEVRGAAAEPLTAALAASKRTQDRVLSEIAAGKLDAMFLPRAISAGVFVGISALNVVPLLKSSSAKVRYGALSILSAKYIPAALVQSEAERLISDPELRIREGAHEALKIIQRKSV